MAWLQVSKAAIADLMKEADVLGSLRHPNVVWVYGIVLPKLQPEQAAGDGSSSDSDGELTGVPGKQPKPGVPGSVRPPAIVTEFMSQGSLKSALQRKADIVQGALMRVLIAMDAAKVPFHPCSAWYLCRIIPGSLSLPAQSLYRVKSAWKC